MRSSPIGPEGPGASVATDAPNTVALLSALRFAGWQGVPLRLRHCDGTNYQINAPIIIGEDFVQFASKTGYSPVRVPFSQIVDFELL